MNIRCFKFNLFRRKIDFPSIYIWGEKKKSLRSPHKEPWYNVVESSFTYGPSKNTTGNFHMASPYSIFTDTLQSPAQVNTVYKRPKKKKKCGPSTYFFDGLV